MRTFTRRPRDTIGTKKADNTDRQTDSRIQRHEHTGGHTLALQGAKVAKRDKLFIAERHKDN